MQLSSLWIICGIEQTDYGSQIHIYNNNNSNNNNRLQSISFAAELKLSTFIFHKFSIRRFTRAIIVDFAFLFFSFSAKVLSLLVVISHELVDKFFSPSYPSAYSTVYIYIFLILKPKYTCSFPFHRYLRHMTFNVHGFVYLLLLLQALVLFLFFVCFLLPFFRLFFLRIPFILTRFSSFFFFFIATRARLTQSHFDSFMKKKKKCTTPNVNSSGQKKLKTENIVFKICTNGR